MINFDSMGNILQPGGVSVGGFGDAMCSSGTNIYTYIYDNRGVFVTGPAVITFA